MKVKLIVDGGAMQPGPAVAQQLGPMGINLGKVISDVNTSTSGFKGMKVPVELDVDPKTKSYTIKVLSPPVAELIKKELALEKGSGEAGAVKVGNIALERVIYIAKTKMSNLLAKDLKAAVKLIAGSCVSLGVLIDNKDPREVIADVNAGNYDREIKGEITEVPLLKKKELEVFYKSVKEKQEKAKKAAEEAAAAAEAAKAAAAAAAGTPAPGAAPAAGAEAGKAAAPAAGAEAGKAAPAKEEKPAKKK